MQTLKALTIDFDPIAQSMRDLCRNSNDYYFHKGTGKVAVISKGVIRFLTQDPSEPREALPDWDVRMVPVARQIVVSGSPDYIRIPEAFGQPDHVLMEKFARDIKAAKLRQKIQQALRGRGACRRFKEILKDHPDEAKSWTQFRTQAWKEKIEVWLKSIGILAIEGAKKKFRSAV